MNTDKGRLSKENWDISYTELDQVLKKGYDWLSKRLSQTMELLSARTVSLAIIAYCHCNYEQYKVEIEKLKKRLISMQKKEDGSWNNELWDTAWAILALATEHFYSTGKPMNFAYPPIRNALKFIEDNKTIRDNWQGEFNESLLTAFSLLDIEYFKEYPFIQKMVQWVLKLQRSEGCWIDIYDTCLATRLLVKAQDRFKKDFSKEVTRALKWLRKWDPEKEGSWVNANMLLCFLDAGVKLNDPIINRLYKWFVENEIEGCWSSYEDEQAYTLRALSELRKKLMSAEVEEIEMDRQLKSRDLKRMVELRLKALGYFVRKNTRIAHSDIQFDIVAEKGILKTTVIVARIFENTVKISDAKKFVEDAKMAKRFEKSIEECWICAVNFSDEARFFLKHTCQKRNLGIVIKLQEL